jgi:hypothetical protein
MFIRTALALAAAARRTCPNVRVERDIFKLHIQFFGQFHGKGSDRSLSHFNLTDEKCDPSVLPDAQKCVVTRFLFLGKQTGLQGGVPDGKRDNQSGTDPFHEIPAGHPGGIAHAFEKPVVVSLIAVHSLTFSFVYRHSEWPG